MNRFSLAIAGSSNCHQYRIAETYNPVNLLVLWASCAETYFLGARFRHVDREVSYENLEMFKLKDILFLIQTGHPWGSFKSNGGFEFVYFSKNPYQQNFTPKKQKQKKKNHKVLRFKSYLGKFEVPQNTSLGF